MIQRIKSFVENEKPIFCAPEEHHLRPLITTQPIFTITLAI